MAGDGITILHASDFQLDVPLGGFRWIPETIKRELLDAPVKAARRVFDAAIAQHVDVLVLTGNLVAPERGSASSLEFMQSQLLRMNEHGIAVIWATGMTDPITQWPRCMQWPETLMRFDSGTAQRRVLKLHDREIEVLGTGCDQTGTVQSEWFSGLSRGAPALAVCGGSLANAPHDLSIPVWLLGSSRYAAVETLGEATLIHAGIPQGRNIQDAGSRGAQLISMGERVECTMVQCAEVLYETVNVSVSDIEDLDHLEILLLQQCESRRWDANQIRLVQWHVDGCEDSAFVRDTDSAFTGWQTKLANDSTLTQLGVFSLGVEVHWGGSAVAAEQGADLLGDYLFTLETLRENGWAGLELGGIRGDQDVRPDWTNIDEDLQGLRTLECAARLGELLLGADRDTSDPHREEAA